VDFGIRKQCLAEAKKLSVEEIWKRRASGLPKIWLIWKVMDCRRGHPGLFDSTSVYEPLSVSGAEASHVLAYRRGEGAVVVTPRLIRSLSGDWADTKVGLPAGRWKNILTGSAVDNGLMKELTERLPMALLLREEES
jgi:(1->4)-alpha-D-glucan 1-alpha-D-glucosylmutase